MEAAKKSGPEGRRVKGVKQMKDPDLMSLDDLKRNLRDCRNELCLLCGRYRMQHQGACDGCRWQLEPEGSVPNA